MDTPKQTGRAGRPVMRVEGVKRITIEISPDDWVYISRVAPNRTRWIIEAIREKREREERS